MTLAKCHNYSGCLHAYRGEEIQIAAGAPMICPECGHAVTNVPPVASKLWAYVPWLVATLVLVAAIAVGAPYVSRMVSKWQTPSLTPHPEPHGFSDEEPTPATPPLPNTASTPKVNGGLTQAVEPPKTVIVQAHIDGSLATAANKRVRDEVLKRIDLMPTVSESNKDRLYSAVERARRMGLVLTIPFPSGQSTLGPGEVAQLKAELDKPEMKKLRDDPTSIFVILGYADPKGDEKKNMDVSQKRADAVLEAMRDRCGVINVMHSVAMGGQSLINAKDLEKNRVVELWIAQP